MSLKWNKSRQTAEASFGCLGKNILLLFTILKFNFANLIFWLVRKSGHYELYIIILLNAQNRLEEMAYY